MQKLVVESFDKDLFSSRRDEEEERREGEKEKRERKRRGEMKKRRGERSNEEEKLALTVHCIGQIHVLQYIAVN